MKIVVIGGSGSSDRLVEKLRQAGHDPLAASPDSGVDTLTGEGLADALEGAQVVVDASNAPAWDDAAVLDFFQTISEHPRRRDRRRGGPLRRAVGRGHRPASGQWLLTAKLAQEEAVKAATVPYTILSATQFYEFIGRIADSSTDGNTVHLPPCSFSPRRPMTSPPHLPTSRAHQ